MIDALLRDGLIAETLGDYRLGDASTLIEDSATGLMLTTLALTDAGFRAIGQEPPAAEPAAKVAPTVPSAETVAQEAAAIADALDAATLAPTPRANLRAAATAVLAAWDDQDNRDIDIFAALEAPMNALRALWPRRRRGTRAHRANRARAPSKYSGENMGRVWKHYRT